MVPVITGDQPGSIDPTLHLGRHFQLEVFLPGCVIQVIIMEMDSAIFLGALLEVGLIPRPVVPRHTTGRPVDSPAVLQVRGEIGDPGGGGLFGEVPGCDQVTAEGQG